MVPHKYMEIFVDGLSRYFAHLDDSHHLDKNPLQIGSPYLIDSKETTGLDYTGLISVSGENHGHVFFSASSSLLRLILLAYGASQLDKSKHKDLVGEVANTIAGNARRELGDGFKISAPKVIEGDLQPNSYDLSPRCFVLPIRWKSNFAELIVNLNDDQAMAA